MKKFREKERGQTGGERKSDRGVTEIQRTIIVHNARNRTSEELLRLYEPPARKQG